MLEYTESKKFIDKKIRLNRGKVHSIKPLYVISNVPISTIEMHIGGVIVFIIDTETYSKLHQDVPYNGEYYKYNLYIEDFSSDLYHLNTYHEVDFFVDYTQPNNLMKDTPNVYINYTYCIYNDIEKNIMIDAIKQWKICVEYYRFYADLVNGKSGRREICCYGNTNNFIGIYIICKDVDSINNISLNHRDTTLLADMGQFEKINKNTLYFQANRSLPNISIPVIEYDLGDNTEMDIIVKYLDFTSAINSYIPYTMLERFYNAGTLSRTFTQSRTFTKYFQFPKEYPNLQLLAAKVVSEHKFDEEYQLPHAIVDIIDSAEQYF